jgi:hypothetical protein
VKIPDHVPAPSRRTRITDWVARNVPFGHDTFYFSLWLDGREVSPSATRIIPWLMLYREHEDFTEARRLFRLPGSKIVELWDPMDEEWLEYPGVDQ